MSLIKFKEVTKSYQSGGVELKAVNSASFTIEENEFVVILGPSGAGKSTLLNLLGGLDYATEGEIIVNGKNISGYNDRELTAYRAKDVGFVFQFYNLIPTLTVYENIALIKEVAKNKPDIDGIIEKVGLTAQKNNFPSNLSGGEQQRASIARAVAKTPIILLCDEPTGALDSETGIKILSLLQEMSKEGGRCVIIVTHNAVLADAADKLIKIKNGKINEVTINKNPKRVQDIVW